MIGVFLGAAQNVFLGYIFRFGRIDENKMVRLTGERLPKS